MKIYSWLRASVLLTMATTVTCAMAELAVRSDDGFWDGPPTNASPTVRIITPEEGSAFLLGDEIDICADVDHFSNHVANVEFWANNVLVGVVSNGVWDSDTYCLTDTNLAVGNYRLTAVATDTGGITATSAVVDISVVTNLPPRVHIVEPENGELILGPTNVEVCAAAFDPDGTVASIEFFNGSNSIGTVLAPPIMYETNEWGVFPIREPFCLTWSNAPAGTHVLTAVASDNGGATGTSAPVTINIVTDLPPRVRIEFPENGWRYLAPANIRISADASSPDDTISKVQFFANGSNSLGVVTTPTVISNSWYVDSDYTLTWSNAPAGTYTLTAVATDNEGVSSTSAPVNVTVSPPPSPKVTITHPRNGQMLFSAPRNIEVCAFEEFFTNPIVMVQFFAGSNGIGTSTSSPYSCIVWSNVPPGAYTLKALATDSHGINATSAPVNINVVTNPPPSRSWED